MAYHARHFGIVEGADANAIVLADEPEGGADAGQIVSVDGYAG
jgi:hypothetical protein